MSEVKLLMGEKYTLELNGTPMGGVYKAKFGSKTDYEDITEFLGDAPAIRIPVKTKYTVSLCYRADANPFECGEYYDIIRLRGKNESLEFTDCTLKTVEEIIESGKTAAYTAELEAYGRRAESYE